jgi:Glycoside-hydrolase family GH114
MSSRRCMLLALVLAVAGWSAAGCGPHEPEPRSATWPAPPANAVFDYQIGGAYRPAAPARIVVRDRGEPSAPGRYNVCYVNAFQTQPDEIRWWETRHPDLLLRDRGRVVEDPDWLGERLLDTTTAPKRAGIAAVVDRWLAECAASGFQAVEPDNLDSWTRSRGLLDQEDNVALARLLVRQAHARGLAVAQKNAAELSAAGRTDVGFDFAIAEECAVERECDDYMAAYGALVYEIEYTDNPVAHYRKACAERGATIAVLLRDRAVTRPGDPAYHNETC